MSEALTRPEKATERHLARRLRKRMDADRARNGNCVICIHREVTFDRPHCRNQPERQMGQCQIDGAEPKFRLDDTTLDKYRDAA